ncbi:MAG TPA: ligase-associated DNA damage response exonuclease [Thermoanaerobaculia bacterium]|jgi:putative mRNA 3-end processing factor|nr:ligase-associated DNA damage response exonuclease [Thermoanaerobaculia bacterium]
MSPPPPLLRVTSEGLYCEAGGFYIDPWKPVEKALITHGHGDHARWGSAAYLTAESGVPVLRRRLAPDARIEGLPFGDSLRLGDVTVSFHSAGHVLGSAQIRVERGGERWIASGDYKRQSDPTCAEFEPVPCDTFITEATFGLPIYRWRETADEARDLLAWWEENERDGRASVLFCYALGKAQRVLGELAFLTDRTVYLHGAAAHLTELYRQAGVRMLPTRRVGEMPRGHSFAGELILAPTSASRSTWMRRFGNAGTAFASGWMRVRGHRRRRGYDRGFVISDHADWPGLLQTIEETGASQVLVTHGYTDSLSRYLRDKGVDAKPLATPYGEEEEGEEPSEDEGGGALSREAGEGRGGGSE